MNPGLPGMGLGGIFYLILVLLMPVRETYLTLRGRSNMERWRVVAFHLLMTSAIVGALIATGFGLKQGFLYLASTNWIGPSIADAAQSATAVSSQWAMTISLSILGTLLVGSAILGMIMRWMPRDADRK